VGGEVEMKLSTTVGAVQIRLDTSRLEGDAKEAQKKLNEQIVADCEPLVPFQQGALRNSVSYPDGIYGGFIKYDTPYSRYLYYGRLYSGSHPIKDAAGNITGWWSEKHKKPTSRRLQYHTPGTTDHWFEIAKGRFSRQWVQVVKDCFKH
jgi:hypothetical protein